MTDPIDPRLLSLLIAPDSGSVFSDYMDQIANKGLLPYKTLFQTGGKQGESLWTHIVNMICVLEALQPLVRLDEIETRVLQLAITVHDINKMRQEQVSYSALAQPPVIAEVIEEIGCDDFFPSWRDYLSDIEALMRAHPGHYPVDGDGLIIKRVRYRLESQHIEDLKHLIRALDIIDLSHSLDERTHKNTFLSHFNAYLDSSGDTRQYAFFTHQIVEQRGLLTNVIHNALMEKLGDTFSLTPLLLYPDGVVYLIERGQEVEIDPSELGNAAAACIQQIITGNVAKLIDPSKDGYKIKPDAFDANVPFAKLWLALRNQLTKRSFKPAEYDINARQGAINKIRIQQAKQPGYAADILDRLEDSAPIVLANQEQFRSAELARAYYLFLKTYLPKATKDPWRYVYQLLDLPEEQWAFYDYFNAANHRLYVLAGDIALSEDEVFERTLTDGQNLLGEQPAEQAQTSSVWMEYVNRYVLINGQPLIEGAWNDHLAHYMTNQHRQCVHCSSPFETDEWMNRDVRDGIKVQKFSYRLEGGGTGEPKKYICEVCRTQFLLEKLSYPSARSEKIFYLHLFPYAFYSAPFVNGLQATFNRLRSTDFALQALFLDTISASRFLAGEMAMPTFQAVTKAGKPHPYGAYIPAFSETTGGAILFPVNPPDGRNDTEQFLFALWYALVLQRHFGVKVLLSRSPVPPLDLHAIPDLYLDHTPLGCSGLLPRNDFSIYEPPQNKQEGPLFRLWEVVQHIFALSRLIGTIEEDIKLPLIRAMSTGSLDVFHTLDRLLQKYDKEKVGLVAFPHVRGLAFYVGGEWMAQLSKYLEALAALAWQHKIKGRSWERSSVLFPVDEVFDKLSRLSGPADRETLMAASVQDIFDHLERIADDKYKPGRTKYQAIEEFVRQWYAGVLDQVYGGNVQRLLGDAKLLRSAYLFYWQAQNSNQP